jgi:hypothetical protein
MTFLAKPFVALGFGAFFLCAATCAHLDEITTSPLSLRPDWAAGVFLIGGAVLSGRNWDTGRAYQIAAWAFMVSLLFGSVVGNIEEWMSHAPDTHAAGLVSMSQGTYLLVVSVLFLVSLGGLIMSLRSRDDDEHPSPRGTQLAG